ncbi:hypothetical protein RRG08_051528 [Elysia crispata]|uniref:Uncharacterized protein n=1 Tax=Elysia crispata TaxID=231223 RepID=A0AAE0Y7Z6_9GAST|nr:hypothetical protein RRG08_051528 [Elysia crispata]
MEICRVTHPTAWASSSKMTEFEGASACAVAQLLPCDHNFPAFLDSVNTLGEHGLRKTKDKVIRFGTEMTKS